MGAGDTALVAWAREGNLGAFSDLVTRYRDAGFGLAYHCLGDFEEVQDAAQETFPRAYSRLERLGDPARFAPRLRRITTRVCLEMLRRPGDRALPLEKHPEVTAARLDEVEQVATRMAVGEALSRLSDRARLTVTLRYINGYSHGEIARFLAVAVTTVRTRLRRAKLQLRKEHCGSVKHGDRYLPLTVGDCWAYVWADAPETFVASEVCRVVAEQENRWYVV